MNDSVCRLAQETTANATILAIMSLVTALDLTSLFLLIVYGHCALTNRALHLNLRAQLLSLTFALVARNFLTLVRAVRMLINAIVAALQSDPCYLLTRQLVCFIESSLNAAPLQTMGWISLVITAERVIATIFYKNYERVKYTAVAVIFALIPWVVQGTLVTTNLIGAISKSDGTLLAYCSSMSSKIIDIFELMGWLVPLCFGNLVGCVLVYIVNKRAKKFEANRTGAMHLTARYQVAENIEATRVITIHTFTFLVFYAGNIYILYFISVAQITHYPTFAIYKEASSLLFPVYGNLYVVLALMLSARMRHKFAKHRLVRLFTSSVQKLCGKRCKEDSECAVAAVVAADQKQDYFDIYRTQWK